MKKILALLLIVSVLVIPELAFATSKDNSVTTRVSYNQYIEYLMKEKNISREQAISEDNLNTRTYLKDQKLGGISVMALDDKVYFASRESTYRYNNTYRAKIGATFKVYQNLSNKEILAITNKYTAPAAGSGNYEWLPSGVVWQDVPSFPTKNALIGGSGYFKVITTYTGGGSLDLGGFEITGSMGSQSILTSATMNMTLSVNASQL